MMRYRQLPWLVGALLGMALGTNAAAAVRPRTATPTAVRTGAGGLSAKQVMRRDIQTLASAIHNYMVDYEAFPHSQKELEGLAPYLGEHNPRPERFQNPITGTVTSFHDPAQVRVVTLDQMAAMRGDPRWAGGLLVVPEGKDAGFLRFLDAQGRPGVPILKIHGNVIGEAEWREIRDAQKRFGPLRGLKHP